MDSSRIKFNEHIFEHKLIKLKDTHDSIAHLSSWCLQNQEHYQKIVTIWLNVMRRVKIEHRVILFYLANDVVQYSKKKDLPFVDSFALAFQKAVTMVREENIRPKIERLFSIWKERGIYDENYLADLASVLTRGKSSSTLDITDFQPSILYSKFKSCKNLEEDTDLKLKILTQNHISLTDVEKMRKSLKEKVAGIDIISEVEEGLTKIKEYINALKVEIKERIGLIDTLDLSKFYYDDQLKEAKIVVNAYKCFSVKVKSLKRKLEERIEELPSPQLSPDINAPSPSPNSTPEKSDLNDLSFCGTNFSACGSFMDGSLIFNDYLKPFEEESPLVMGTTDSSSASYNPLAISTYSPENPNKSQLKYIEPVTHPELLEFQSNYNINSNYYSPTMINNHNHQHQHFHHHHHHHQHQLIMETSSPKWLPNKNLLHPPAISTTTMASPVLTSLFSVTPPNSVTSSVSNFIPNRHLSTDNSTITSGHQTSNIDTTIAVTRSQILDNNSLKLSALLESLLPNTNPMVDFSKIQTPRSPSPE